VSAYAAYVADVNRDGRPDIVLTGPSGITVMLDEPLAPVVSNALQSARKWRAGNRLARIERARVPVGTTYSFSLNETARVSLVFERLVRGRTVRGTCVAPTRARRHRRACSRRAPVGTLSFTGHTGTNRVVFQGRLSSSTRLKPGSYELTITATNTVGLRSAPVILHFTVVS
jgi:hypothetical protein